MLFGGRTAEASCVILPNDGPQHVVDDPAVVDSNAMSTACHSCCLHVKIIIKVVLLNRFDVMAGLNLLIFFKSFKINIGNIGKVKKLRVMHTPNEDDQGWLLNEVS